MSRFSFVAGASCFLFFLMFGQPIWASQRLEEVPFGIAWNVQGNWQTQGLNHPLLNGDAVFPGALLQATSEDSRHAITILLPDGQSISYQCYRTADCTRGFRVPELFRKPQSFANAMIRRIYAVLMRESTAERASWLQDPTLSQDEALSVLNPDQSVDIAGLAATMPNGHYSCEISRLEDDGTPLSHVEIDKSGPSIRMVLPGPGLYHAKFYDQFNNPRVDLFIAAVDARQFNELIGLYRQLNALLAEWNEDLLLWPAHALRRLYLESLVSRTSPRGPAIPARMDGTRRADTTAEPSFSPRPGVSHRDLAVQLQCATPGATIYFTIDGAPPLKNSAVYRAPVISRGSDLTIKAFASAPGKKESAVVTGTFQFDDN